jgi:hypothetical protein
MVGRRKKQIPNFTSPPRLYWIVTESILNHLTKICSPFSVEVKEDFRKIRFFLEEYLGQLPRAVQDHVLKEAELTLVTIQ